jgi:hypothetical protein
VAESNTLDQKYGIIHPQEVDAVQYFQNLVRAQNITQLKRKNNVNFRTNPTRRGPLKNLFRQMNFKPMVFGTFGEISSNLHDFVNIVVDYGAENLGTSMTATVPP